MDECREAFEEWYEKETGSKPYKNPSGDYAWGMVRDDWDVWQAAWHRRAPSGWQDIATAPKDGTVIIGGFLKNGEFEYAESVYYVRLEDGGGLWCWQHDADAPINQPKLWIPAPPNEEDND